MLSGAAIISNSLSSVFQIVNRLLNENLEEYPPATIVWLTLGGVLFTQQALKAYHTYRHHDFDQIKDRATDYAVIKVLKTPGIGKMAQAYIDKELHKALDSLQKEVEKFDQDHTELPNKIPLLGINPDEIIQIFKSLPSNENDYKKSGAVYIHIDEKLKKLLAEISVLTNYTNPMHEHWQFLNRLQGRIISMTKDLFNGPEGTYGIITHGGTTSILEACKSYVLHARQVLFIDEPEIIVPQSAHPAFEKAARILNATLRVAPLDPATGQVDIKAMEKLINKNTCLLVGSAPSYPYGQFDDIEKIGQLGLKHQKPVHVDACLGGFLSAFAKDANVELPRWGMDVPGVTSLSADIHKYGYAPKGCSFVYFHPSCQASPTYTNLTSSCGMYVTEGIDGSRSGQPIAEAFCTLMYFGRNYYIEEAKKIFETRKNLVDKLNAIDGIRVMYHPQHSVIGIQSSGTINLSVVAEQFQKQGWSVNALPASPGMAFHFCITSVHANTAHFVDAFAADLDRSVTYAKEHPLAVASGMVKAYGKLSTEFIPNYVKNTIGSIFSKLRTMDPRCIPGFSYPRPEANMGSLESASDPRKKFK